VGERPDPAARDSGPAETLRYQFEAISRMPEPDQVAIRVLLDAAIVKNLVAGAIERVAKQPAVTAPVPAPAKDQAKTRRAQAGGARRSAPNCWHLRPSRCASPPCPSSA
jgi:hypothetical protein